MASLSENPFYTWHENVSLSAGVPVLFPSLSSDFFDMFLFNIEHPVES